jgi:glutaredoxin
MFYPSATGYTIYSKSECIYCDRVKLMLEHHFNITVYSCDEMLERDRNGFLAHMDSLTGREHRTFPFVFHNGVFIGGCDDTKAYLASHVSFSEDF